MWGNGVFIGNNEQKELDQESWLEENNPHWGKRPIIYETFVIVNPRQRGGEFFQFFDYHIQPLIKGPVQAQKKPGEIMIAVPS